MKLIDSHAHLDLPEFAPDFDAVVRRAAAAGVAKIITIGIDLESSRQAVRLAAAHENVFAAVGIHPCDSATATDENLTALAALATSPGVVAIGETGLDFYHKPFSEAEQRKSLDFHLNLAVKTGLPVIIHSREADEAMAPLLSAWAAANPVHPKGVIHCFNGDTATSDSYLESGFYIALGGYVSYPSARKNHDIYRQIPLERLLLETDCPFLPPQAYRGQRNEPAYLMQTAEALADIRGITMEALARATTENVTRLFRLTG
jgi:TatD DNase family protein